MKLIRCCLVGLALVQVVMALGCGSRVSDPAGIWTGSVSNPSGERVAFTLEVTRGDGGRYGVTLRNGEDRTPSTGAGVWDGRTLSVPFNYYDAELKLTIEGDQLSGEFTRQWQKQILRRALSGRRGEAQPVVAPDGVSLAGEWVLAVGAAPNQRYWRASFQQDRSGLQGTLIPVSGDWGRFYRVVRRRAAHPQPV